jgi:signal peptidase I
MAKRKRSKRPGDAGHRPEASKTRSTKPEEEVTLKRDSTRELIESVVIALVLAFLFRSFEAEAFEIPTGSMGPTLMGRHKDVECPKCGYEYRAGASMEVEDKTEIYNPQWAVKTVTCPMCRYTTLVDPNEASEDPLTLDAPSYAGDKIWVSKTPFALADPKRWDVAVFKYPDEASQNFIKRIVGLPGETLRIYRGDIYVMNKDEDKGRFQIARKPPQKARVLMQPVYDNDYVLPEILDKGWPARWQSDDDGNETGRWVASEDFRDFSNDGASQEPRWLRYWHYAPSYKDWTTLSEGPLSPGEEPLPGLIRDFTGYNSATSSNSSRAPLTSPGLPALGWHWVGDLSVSCELTSSSTSGTVLLELIEGGRRHQCQIDLESGMATLHVDEQDDFAPSAQTEIRGKGTWEVMFANVDDQLLLWIDDEVVTFDQPTTFTPPEKIRPTEADLAPVGIASIGAALDVAHLKVFRDVYYLARMDGPDYGRLNSNDMDWFFETPSEWDAFLDLKGSPVWGLGEDDFFAMGDNSPNSKDGRSWGTVKRDLLIGKALFVYWPHAWPTEYSIPVNVGPFDFRFPFLPNVSRMRTIH